MAKKISLKLGYQSPFTVFSVFSTQKDYRMAWLINQHLGFDLKRISDYSHFISETNSAKLPMYAYHYERYRMHVFLLGNKSEEGSVFPEHPVADYLLLLWNLSDFFDLAQFQRDLKKIQQIQTIATLSEKALKKQEAFFYDLEYFLTEQSVI